MYQARLSVSGKADDARHGARTRHDGGLHRHS
jgi:hypothetical protein